MYKNAAEKLFGFVKMITILMMGLSVLGGLAVASVTDSLLAGIVVGAIGCVLAWLSNLVIATFAQIGMDVHALAEGEGLVDVAQKTENTQTKVAQPAREWWTCAACGEKNLLSTGTCQRCGVSKSWSEEQWNSSIVMQDEWECSVCGRINERCVNGKETKFCVDCGAKLEE